jgi:hypothetical protein
VIGVGAALAHRANPTDDINQVRKDDEELNSN